VVDVAFRAEVARRVREGGTQRGIARELGCSSFYVQVVSREVGGTVKPYELARGVGRGLEWEQRREIFDGLRNGLSYRAIGGLIGRSASCVCREIQRGGGRGDYRPSVAHREATTPGRPRRHPRKLDNPELLARVVTDLERLMSPQQIAGRLRKEFGKDSAMSISHETIYKSLYVQGKGQLRRELNACLRSGRTQRKHRGEREKRGRIPDMVNISQRPPEAQDRAFPGHWEGDLIIGAFGRSAIGTLVERSTRYTLLLHLPGDHTATAVRDAMAAKIQQLPEHLRRSITWDQGSEMAQHRQFTIDTGIAIYFCDPHSPWQRGTNENTNGLLRQYFPKGTDLSIHSPDHLDTVADSLNNRPRKTLDYDTPTERLAPLVALTI
jgi:transposase, IS30 family